MIDFVFEPAFWASLALLIGMEVALGADNVVFISTVADKLPEQHRKRILQIGMAMAALFRLVLLAGIVWILGLQRTAFTIAGWSPSWRELILLGGGLFLVYKAVSELHLLVEHSGEKAAGSDVTISESPTLAVIQIVLINAVFSVDSIITAIGLTHYVEAMAIAVIVSIAILYFAARTVGALIDRHPSIKALALGFLLMVGIVLVADGLGLEILRPYLYGAMAFGILVLGIVKLVHRKPRAEPIPAATPVVAERPEPNLEPIPEQPAEPRIEPVVDEPALAVVEPEETAESPEDIGLPESPEPEEPVEVEEAPDDEPALGEDEEPMQKSRRKRPALRRRPERLRTARRRK